MVASAMKRNKAGEIGVTRVMELIEIRSHKRLPGKVTSK
jgi:hypothetical protein